LAAEDDDEPNEHWRQKGKLALSLLTFAGFLFDAVNALLTDLIKTGRDAGYINLKTNQGRPVRLILAIGEDAVAATDSIIQKEPTKS
jgi:hypothetical protein